MVLLVTTPTIIAALEELSSSTRDDLQLPTTPAVGEPISHDQVISLARYFRCGDGSTTQSIAASSEIDSDDYEERAATTASYTLNTLLRGTEVYIRPAPPKPEPSLEYLALKARLQAAAEEQAYQRLISPPSLTATHGPSPIFAASSSSPSSGDGVLDAEMTADNDPITPSLVINIFMSVLLCGFATFWALKNFQTPAFLSFTTATNKPLAGTATQSEPVFVLISMFVGLLVGVAEVVVYAAYLRKVAQAKAKERGIKERKEIIVPPEEEQRSKDRDENVEETREQEEIWGKGVNGGVRRRVRDRWESRKQGHVDGGT